MFARLSGVLVSVVLLGLTGCTIHSEALKPTPNVVSPGRAPGAVTLDVSEVPAHEVCSHSEGMLDLCVTGLQSSFQAGFVEVLNDFFGKATDAPAYTAKFKVVEFTHSAAAVAGAAAFVNLRWQFQLVASDGTPLLQLAETTRGSRALASRDDTDACVKTLVEESLERVAKALGEREKPAAWAPENAGPAVVAIKTDGAPAVAIKTDGGPTAAPIVAEPAKKRLECIPVAGESESEQVIRCNREHRHLSR